jgi:hypothetical protein
MDNVHTSALVALVSARRPVEPPPPSSVGAAEARAPPHDRRAAPPSCGSRATRPAVTGHRSGDPHTAASFLHSRGSASAGPHPPGVDCGTGACADPVSLRSTPAVHSAQRARPPTGPRLASPWARPVFCGERLQRLDVQRLLRHHRLQPPGFVFQLAERLHVADFKPRILGPPLITGGIRDAVRAAERRIPIPAWASLCTVMICSLYAAFESWASSFRPITA